jgi:uncharacterized protein YjdB
MRNAFKKLRLSMCLPLALVLPFITGIAAITASAQQYYPDAGISVVVNGERVIFPDQHPFVLNDRTYVPVRFVAEKMFAEVEWYQESLTAVIERNNAMLALQVGNAIMTVSDNGSERQQQMDVAPFVVNGRTMIPIRFVMEALGAWVDWDGSTLTVIVEDPFTRIEDGGMSPVPDAPAANLSDSETYYQAINVKLSARPSDAAIFYTTDGSAPTDNSTFYNDGGSGIALNESTTIRAVAVNENGLYGPESIFRYTLEITDPNIVEVPKLTDLAEEAALSAIAKAGFQAIKVDVYDSTVKTGFVISQSPEALTKAPKGSNISIQISKGTSYTVTITKKGSSSELGSVTLAPGDAIELAAATQLKNAAITWRADNSSVAIVNQSGVVSAASAGQCVITASNGNELWDGKLVVIVQEKVIPATEVRVTSYPQVMQVGESGLIVCTVTPLEATDKLIYWVSSNSAIVTVDANGVATAHQPGTVTVTVALANGNSVNQISIAVEAPIDDAQTSGPPLEFMADAPL